MAADELLVTAEQITAAWPAYSGLPALEQESLLNTSSQAVLDHCDCSFLKSFIIELHDGGSRSIWLSTRPIITVDYVLISGEAVDNSDGLGWQVNKKTGQLVLAASWWPNGMQNITSGYWGGFDSVPDPVQRATIITAKYLGERLQVSGIYASERIGDYSYTLNSISQKPTLPDAALDLLAPYVKKDFIL